MFSVRRTTLWFASLSVTSRRRLATVRRTVKSIATVASSSDRKDTDGVDHGSSFKLDHLVHYARYAGVPVYPIIKNRILSRLMHFGIGQLEARRLTSLARDTGATYFIIRREDELPGVYAKIAAELRQQYQLVFYSDPAAADEWHSLAIESRSGQQLRIPKGYFP